MIRAISIEVLETAESVARRSAAIIAEEARNLVAARDRFVMAGSGGRTPRPGWFNHAAGTPDLRRWSEGNQDRLHRCRSFIESRMPVHC